MTISLFCMFYSIFGLCLISAGIDIPLRVPVAFFVGGTIFLIIETVNDKTNKS